MSIEMDDCGDYINISLSVAAAHEIDKYPAKQHARRVATEMAVKEGLIYLPGQATQLLEDSDMDAPFRQLRYFYYLTGVNEADAFVTYDIATDLLTLYITILPPLKAIWVGDGLSTEEAASLFDVDVVKSADSLASDLTSWIGKHAGTPVYILHNSQKPKLDYSIAADPFDSEPLQNAVDACRVIKDSFELGLLRKANEIAAIAHTEVLRNICHFTNERQVQAIFEEACTSRGVTTQSYGVIAGSGPNAAVLHYMKNNEPFGNRQLLLIDAGPDWNCYASDVTRTFPICGYWPSKEAQQIYSIVDEMQTACIELIKPGAKMADLPQLANQIMVKHLQKLGIFKKGYSIEDIISSGAARIFLPHGISHHVGLEVHDVSPSVKADSPVSNDPMEQAARGFKAVPPPHISATVLFEENMVVTVEPGIYFSEVAFTRLVDDKLRKYIDLHVAREYLPVGGVRIEDDILVTKDGYENLTTTPKGEQALRIIRGEE